VGPASSSRPLVYGVAQRVSWYNIKGCIRSGGEVTGVVPWAMIKAGGEGDKGANVEKGGEEKFGMFAG